MWPSCIANVSAARCGKGCISVHFANSGEDALGKLAGGVKPTLIAILSGHEHAGDGQARPAGGARSNDTTPSCRC